MVFDWIFISVMWLQSQVSESYLKVVNIAKQTQEKNIFLFPSNFIMITLRHQLQTPSLVTNLLSSSHFSRK